MPQHLSLLIDRFLLDLKKVSVSLGKNRVTTHWEDQKELQDRFPDLTVIPNQRWVESEGIFTSGGISAGIDLSLHLVQVLSDRELALRTAKQMEYNWNQ